MQTQSIKIPFAMVLANPQTIAHLQIQSYFIRLVNGIAVNISMSLKQFLKLNCNRNSENLHQNITANTNGEEL